MSEIAFSYICLDYVLFISFFSFSSNQWPRRWSVANLVDEST